MNVWPLIVQFRRYLVRKKLRGEIIVPVATNHSVKFELAEFCS